MKPILTLFALVFIFTSCQKKFTYQCETIYWNQSGGHNYVTKTMTEKEKDKYVSDNKKDIDGTSKIITDGEYWTECIKK